MDLLKLELWNCRKIAVRGQGSRNILFVQFSLRSEALSFSKDELKCLPVVTPPRALFHSQRFLNKCRARF